MPVACEHSVFHSGHNLYVTHAHIYIYIYIYIHIYMYIYNITHMYISLNICTHIRVYETYNNFLVHQPAVRWTVWIICYDSCLSTFRSIHNLNTYKMCTTHVKTYSVDIYFAYVWHVADSLLMTRCLLCGVCISEWWHSWKEGEGTNMIWSWFPATDVTNANDALM